MAKHLREQGNDMLLAVALRGFFRWHRKDVKRKSLEAAGEDPDAVEALMNERTQRSGPRSGGRSGGGGRRDGGRSGGGGRRR